jgi:hypothetical protein
MEGRATPRIWRLPVICATATKGATLRPFTRLRWEEHFRIAGAVVEPLTQVGATTAQLLRLNVTDRVTERQLLQSLNRYPRV